MLICITGYAQIKTGAEQTEKYLSELQGKKVAIVANQTSVIRQTHLVDSLLKLEIPIQKIFAPEHGFRGHADAGEHVLNGLDKKTGVPIVSLYGKNKKPSKNQLKDIDVIVFDIQDVGVRFYTYISTLHYIMEAAAEAKIRVVVLDRPNPNGHYVDGPVLDSAFTSFVGMHPVPIVHGMTIGEYAQMINGEFWLKNKVVCNLKVIPCEKYTHNTPFSLPIYPSPNLRSDQAIKLYPSLALFEGTIVSVGRGTSTPFEIIGYPSFQDSSFSFTPKSSFGAKYPKHQDKICYGYSLSDFGEHGIDNHKGIYLHWLIGMYKLNTQDGFFSNAKFFDLLAGSDQLREQIEDNYSELQIKHSWQDDLNAFKQIRKKYLLYDDFE